MLSLLILFFCVSRGDSLLFCSFSSGEHCSLLFTYNKIQGEFKADFSAVKTGDKKIFISGLDKKEKWV